MDLSADNIRRKVTGNQPHPALLIFNTLEQHGIDNHQLAADLLDALNRHYELRPR